MSHGTRVTKAVVLTVSLAAYTGETVTFNNALESFTFRSTDNIYECHVLCEDVGNGESVA